MTIAIITAAAPVYVAAAFVGCFGLKVRRVGGLVFIRAGRFGGSFYISRR